MYYIIKNVERGMAMHRQKIYLDTSVISYLQAEDTPEKMQYTLDFWYELKDGKYKVVVSDLTLFEISKCREPKRSLMITHIGEVEFTEVKETPESISLAEKYIYYGVLNQKSFDDCRHMAVATLEECDLIVSWNFKHFVNLKTLTRLQAVNKLLGYKEVAIYPPEMLLEGDDE